MFIALASIGVIRNIGDVRGAATNCIVRTTFEAVFPNNSIQSVEITTKVDIVAEISVQIQEGKKENSIVVSRHVVPVTQRTLPYLNSQEFLESLSPDDRKNFDKRVKFFTKHLRLKEAAAMAQIDTAQQTGIGGEGAQQMPSNVEVLRRQELVVSAEEETKQIGRVAFINKMVNDAIVTAEIPYNEIAATFPQANMSAVEASLTKLAAQMSGGASK